MNAIDLFAGAGGTSTGAKQAGVTVLWAANHWQTAVLTHAANHPETDHACQDLHLADWTRLKPYDWCLASPSCKGHARARGKERPHHDAERATAWAFLDCIETTLPLGFTVENPGLKVPAAASFLDLESGNWSAVDKPGRAENTLAKIAASRARIGPRFLVLRREDRRLVGLGRLGGTGGVPPADAARAGKIGVTGIFLDPPYSAEADRDPSIYSHDDLTVAHAVREWAIANGSNPKLRIALCGYEGEHEMPEDWQVVSWKAVGGYAASAGNTENAKRERIWFSPHCEVVKRQRGLFDALEVA